MKIDRGAAMAVKSGPASLIALIEPMESRLLRSSAPVHVRLAVNHVAPEVHASAKKIAPQKGQTKTVSANTHHFKPGEISESGPFSRPLIGPAAAGAIAPFTPGQIRNFYGINAIAFGAIIGDGTGQTIAVIDAYNDPKFVNTGSAGFAASDLHVFDQALMGGIDPPSFSVIPEAGQGLPTTYNAGWAGETALDVEWSHAIAPKANIVLVECLSSSDTDLITNGVAAARAAGASVISMSFGGGEGSSSFLDQAFTTNPGNNNVTYVASTGDNGVTSTGYPSLSPDVLAVGGTTISTADSAANYGSEVVWNDTSTSHGATGGGISASEPKPAYQAGESLSGTNRGVPDVAFLADPQTGVYVRDTSQAGGGGYYQFGGTSLSSPCWAGLIAIADQGRVLNGQSPMNGLNTTLPRLYALPSTAFHDITSGNNTYTPTSAVAGYSAVSGYDLVSGLGTPVANALVADLAGVATITGRVFVDTNNDGLFNGSDTSLSGQTVYLDLNNNGVQDPGEPSMNTDGSGNYSFTDQPAGGTVRLTSPTVAGYVAVPTNTATTLTYGTTDTVNFAFFPITFSSTTASTSYTLQTDNTGTIDQILVNGTLMDSVAKSLLPTLTFSMTGTGDSLTINGANGNPVPTGGVTFAGGAVGDALTVIGTAAGNDSFAVTSSSIAFGSTPVSFTNVSSLLLNPGTGIDSLAVNSGSVTIAAQAAGQGILTRQFSSVALAANATAVFANAAAHTDRTLSIIANLSVASGAKLDVGENDVIVQNGNVAALFSLLGSGYNNGDWSGAGIASIAAAGDPTHLTAIGMMANTTGFFGTSNLFDGYAPATTDVLLKYTYYGDANLDGRLDGSDYSQIDNGFNNALTGWANGDFNYDTHIDGSDYALIDNSYNLYTAGNI